MDATERPREADKEAIGVLRHSKSPTFLIVNKIDLLDNREQMLPAIEFFRELHQFEDFLPVSALAANDVERLRALIIERLPEGPPYFPADHVTDQPARFIAAELVRERILIETRQEVPHSVVVLVDKWEESENLIRIFATIYVERDGQKAIILGSRGAMIKKIGTGPVKRWKDSSASASISTFTSRCSPTGGRSPCSSTPSTGVQWRETMTKRLCSFVLLFALAFLARPMHAGSKVVSTI